MKITVRCFLIPADITFDTDDIEEAINNSDATRIFFKGGLSIEVDRQHYYAEKAKIT